MNESTPKATIGALTTWYSGGTPDRSREDYWNGDIPWISASTLKEPEIRTSNQFITTSAVAAGSKMAPIHSTLLLVRGSALHSEIRAGMVVAPVAFNQDVKALAPKRGLVPKYLTHVIRGNESELLKLVTSAGNTAGVLDTQTVQAFEIYLPSESEQEALVEAFDDVDWLIASLKRLITKKQAVRQGIMQRLLTGETRLPGFTAPWTRRSLGSVGTFLKGRGVKRDDVLRFGIPCIRYGELYTAFDNYTRTTRSFVSPDIAATALPLKTGDVLFAGSGETRDEIGKCVAYIGSTPAVAGGDIVVLRGDGFDSVYLGLLANTAAIVDQKSRAGQGDAVVHISSRALADIEVDLPPRDEQEAIAEVVVDADHEIELLRKRLEKAETLKQGMMQELLTGRTRLPVMETAS